MNVKVQIGKKSIGEGEPCFISLEPGATYSNIDDAKEMIKATAASGADAVKFQTFLTGDAERILGRKDITINFTTTTGKKKELVFDALKRRELTREEWIELIQYSRKQNISFITAPYFSETIDFLNETGVDAIKVSKGDINNVILIDKISKTNLPVILDGREKFEDVDKAIKICEKNNNKKIIIYHCPSGYPSENSGIHLRAIKAIHEKYPYPVGYADHSPNDTMNYAAVALGANMLEKTITQDKTKENVEHYMSLELDELKKFIQNIRAVEQAMGDAKILMTSRVEENARRSIVAKRNIEQGEKITVELLDFRRPGNMGISAADGFDVIGKKASKTIQEGTFLNWDMLD